MQLGLLAVGAACRSVRPKRRCGKRRAQVCSTQIQPVSLHSHSYLCSPQVPLKSHSQLLFVSEKALLKSTRYILPNLPALFKVLPWLGSMWDPLPDLEAQNLDGRQLEITSHVCLAIAGDRKHPVCRRGLSVQATRSRIFQRSYHR